MDEKKDVILPILEALRGYNPQIGNYKKSILNEHFQYIVKLDNGRLTLSQEIVYDYEQSPAFVTEDQLRYSASTFVPVSIYSASAELRKENVSQSEVQSDKIMMQSAATSKEGSSLKRLLILVGIVVLVMIGYYIAGQINRQKDSAVREGFSNQEEDNKREIRNNILSYLTAETNQYETGSLGGIRNLVITINNPN